MQVLQTTDFFSGGALTHTRNETKTTSKYKTISSLTIAGILQSHPYDFKLIETSISKPRKEANKGFQKHIMVFDTGYTIDDQNTITLLVTNSYDGMQSLQFNLGIFRTVCANGLIVGDSLFKSRILHKGESVEQQLAAMFYELAECLPKLFENVVKMQTTPLENQSALMFVESVLDFTYSDTLDRYEIDSTSIADALQVRRLQDHDASVYNLFNRVQENVCKKGVRLLARPSTMETQRSIKPYRKMRPIKNIDRYKKVNAFMWDNAVNLTKLGATG